MKFWNFKKITIILKINSNLQNNNMKIKIKNINRYIKTIIN